MDWHPARSPHAAFFISAAMMLGAGSANANVRVVGPAEVLARFCKVESGRLVLTVPGVAPQELVTQVDDPVIANRGDGSFHPLDPEVVTQALNGLTFPVDQVDAVVYVLPFPRRAGLVSAAAPGAILLAPGVRPVPVDQVHAEVAHEFGHVVQYQYATRGSGAWVAYLRLRGLVDADARAATLSHANRPAEIFAEDFRTLCGSVQAKGDGSIENALLAPPTDLPDLAAFLLDLPARARRTASADRNVAAFPNPFTASTTVTFAARAGAANSTAAPARFIRVVDVRGRIVRHAEAQTASDGSAAWRWDGVDDRGVALARGSYFVTADGIAGPAERIVLLR
jgi:hypothetical protein